MISKVPEDTTWYYLFEDERTESHSKKDFDHQVAGHVSKRLTTFLSDYVLKPRIKFDLFDNEIRFYEAMRNLKNESQEYNKFTPNYHGVYHEKNRDDLYPDCAHSPYIVLNDLTAGYSRPNLMDVKMGQQTYEPTAKPDKKSREILKYTHQLAIGFRITGFKVFNVITQQYDEIDKHFGRSLLPEHIDFGLAYFFFNGLVFHLTVIRNAIAKLAEILVYMEKQTEFHYYCSSLLIVYDADNNVGSSSACCSLENSLNSVSAEVIHSASVEEVDKGSGGLNVIEHAMELTNEFVNVENSRVTVSMIDFAHTVRPPAQDPSGESIADQVDSGYIHGLRELIQRLSAIVGVLESGDSRVISEFKACMLSYMGSSNQLKPREDSVP